jgi:hypothetical protein
MGAVEDYVSYYGAHQWQQLRTVFDHSDFRRTGYADLFTDADAYVDFLEEIAPTFGADYGLQLERIVYAPGEEGGDRTTDRASRVEGRHDRRTRDDHLRLE